MKRSRFFREQSGMTLLEALVTLAVLSVVFTSTLTIYLKTYKNFQTRSSLLNLVHDSDLVMSGIGSDIRRSRELFENYQHEAFVKVVAAMKIVQGDKETAKEKIIVYSLDAEHPNRLLRSVHSAEEGNIISTELSRHVQSIKIIPKLENVFDIYLTVKDEAAGKKFVLQTSSSYAMRY